MKKRLVIEGSANLTNCLLFQGN